MNRTIIHPIRKYVHRNQTVITNNIKVEIKRPIYKCKYENIFDNLPNFEVEGVCVVKNRKLVPGMFVQCLIEQTIALVVALQYDDAVRIFGESYIHIYKFLLFIPNTNISFLGERNHPAKETSNEITRLIHDCKISRERSERIESIDFINDLKSLDQFLEEFIHEKKGPTFWEVLVSCLSQTLWAPEAEPNDVDESYNLSLYKQAILFPIENFLSFILDDSIVEQKRNYLKCKADDPELDFLRSASPIKPDIQLYNKRYKSVSLVGEFKTGDLSFNSLEDFAEKKYCVKLLVSYLIAGNVSNTFITNGQNMLLLELPGDTLVQRKWPQNLNSNSDETLSERHIGFRYFFLDEFAYLESYRRGVKYNITSRMLFMSLIIKNHLKSQYSPVKNTKMSKNIKDLVMEIKLPVREVERESKGLIHTIMTDMTRNIAMRGVDQFTNIEKAVEYLEIRDSFEYNMLQMNSNRTAMIIKPKKSELKKLGIKLALNSPQASNFLLKIYDSSIIAPKFGFSSSFTDFFDNHCERFILYTYRTEFVKEFTCYQRIIHYNVNCDDPNLKINIPRIYTVGPICTKDFQGFYIGMEMLDFPDQKPRTKYDINLGIEQIDRLNSLGIIHNDIGVSNVCIDRRFSNFYIFNFENAIINSNEDNLVYEEDNFQVSYGSLYNDLIMLQKMV